MSPKTRLSATLPALCLMCIKFQVVVHNRGHKLKNSETAGHTVLGQEEKRTLGACILFVFFFSVFQRDPRLRDGATNFQTLFSQFA